MPGRWGKPAEIAGTVVFLAGNAASLVPGQTLAVDGSLTVVTTIYGWIDRYRRLARASTRPSRSRMWL